ncbi:uncharacterized protein PRCAT00001173001 [Priceomyces carsonii]|uniref:uncharacterized protein n=1 Tax=Priceomyces carsonii TaxID=28549 RepID=UPI002ED9BA87|nr:unnamed protein product [Priceomyces carsonii]
MSAVKEYPEGMDPYAARQHLLHHTYSPLISIESSVNSDILIRSILNVKDVSLLQILQPYGNNAKYGIPNQLFKIVNSQLITKNYPSFPVRFEPTLPELISIDQASNNKSGNQLNQLFSISSLELLMTSISQSGLRGNDLYLDFFSKIISSNKIVPFETFNHPVAQIFVIDYENDSIEELRKLIVNFRNFPFPKYFQIDDLLVHAFVFFDSTKISHSEISEFQIKIKNHLNILSTALPVDDLSKDDLINLPLNENSTIEEDLQRISLNDQLNTIKIPTSLDLIIRSKVFEFVSKCLVPHMQEKTRQWDDQFLQPRRSITNKFFSASKRLFNNDNIASSTFEYQGNYYHKSSPEQIIRKLADWSLILNDFKYAYSTYDLIKRDFTNDKAWAYVASTQEMCIVSLLLAQTQQITNVTAPDRATLRKIRHDIVEPFVDNLSYTFKSRLNLKTYSIKTILIIVELLLSMSLTFNISWWWNDLIEKYLCKCINEFDTHLASRNQDLQVIRALLYERLGYCSGKLVFLTDKYRYLLRIDFQEEKNEPPDDGFYHNVKKLKVPENNSILGLTRFRKSSIWYLLSIKEWLILKNYEQAVRLISNVRYNFITSHLTDKWYDRSDLLLGFIKRTIEEHDSRITTKTN